MTMHKRRRSYANDIWAASLAVLSAAAQYQLCQYLLCPWPVAIGIGGNHQLIVGGGCGVNGGAVMAGGRP